MIAKWIDLIHPNLKIILLCATLLWGIWIGIGSIAVIAWFLPRLRDPVLEALKWVVGRVAKKARFRSQINLAYCLP